jgi:hypothetical protein
MFQDYLTKTFVKSFLAGLNLAISSDFVFEQTLREAPELHNCCCHAAEGENLSQSFCPIRVTRLANHPFGQLFTMGIFCKLQK